MASSTTPVEQSNGEDQTEQISLTAHFIGHRQASMSETKRVDGRNGVVKRQKRNLAGLPEVIRATRRLWRKHHLSYDQSK